MQISAFGRSLDITLAKKQAPGSVQLQGQLNSIWNDQRGSWWPIVHEPFSGAWQRNVEWTLDSVLSHPTVYACVSLISQDVGKLRPKLMEMDPETGIWTEVTSPAFSPVLRKPNAYQTRIQFIEWWILSRLLRGNAYALKERDERNVVVALHLLDPSRVRVLVSPEGAVYYELYPDLLAGVGLDQREERIVVPADEIIHDRANCIFHPLIGTSPLFAAGAAAMVGKSIEANSARFFRGNATPAGILTSPLDISPEKAEEFAERWNARFGAGGRGGVAILGMGMSFTPMTMTAVDAQMIDQLKWTDEKICSVFHVPAFKVGVGAQPTYSNGEILDQAYYSQCLQAHIEAFELAMDEGLGILTTTHDARQLGVELDLDGLLRMDTATHVKTLSDAVGAGIMAPNEARRRLDLEPVAGGALPYMQQQNFSLESLARRDAAAPAPAGPPPAQQAA